MNDALRAACRRAIHVHTADDEMLRAGRAVVFVLAVLGYPTSAKILSLPPVLFFVEVAYRIVSNNRRFFARLFFRKERPLPDSAPL